MKIRELFNQGLTITADDLLATGENPREIFQELYAHMIQPEVADNPEMFSKVFSVMRELHSKIPKNENRELEESIVEDMLSFAHGYIVDKKLMYDNKDESEPGRKTVSYKGANKEIVYNQVFDFLKNVTEEIKYKGDAGELYKELKPKYDQFIAAQQPFAQAFRELFSPEAADSNEQFTRKFAEVQELYNKIPMNKGQVTEEERDLQIKVVKNILEFANLYDARYLQDDPVTGGEKSIYEGNNKEVIYSQIAEFMDANKDVINENAELSKAYGAFETKQREFAEEKARTSLAPEALAHQQTLQTTTPAAQGVDQTQPTLSSAAANAAREIAESGNRVKDRVDEYQRRAENLKQDSATAKAEEVFKNMTSPEVASNPEKFPEALKAVVESYDSIPREDREQRIELAQKIIGFANAYNGTNEEMVYEDVNDFIVNLDPDIKNDSRIFAPSIAVQNKHLYGRNSDTPGNDSPGVTAQQPGALAAKAEEAFKNMTSLNIDNDPVKFEQMFSEFRGLYNKIPEENRAERVNVAERVLDYTLNYKGPNQQAINDNIIKFTNELGSVANDPKIKDKVNSFYAMDAIDSDKLVGQNAAGIKIDAEAEIKQAYEKLDESSGERRRSVKELVQEIEQELKFPSQQEITPAQERAAEDTKAFANSGKVKQAVQEINQAQAEGRSFAQNQVLKDEVPPPLPPLDAVSPISAAASVEDPITPTTSTAASTALTPKAGTAQATPAQATPAQATPAQQQPGAAANPPQSTQGATQPQAADDKQGEEEKKKRSWWKRALGGIKEELTPSTKTMFLGWGALMVIAMIFFPAAALPLLLIGVVGAASVVAKHVAKAVNSPVGHFVARAGMTPLAVGAELINAVLKAPLALGGLIATPFNDKGVIENIKFATSGMPPFGEFAQTALSIGSQNKPQQQARGSYSPQSQSPRQPVQDQGAAMAEVRSQDHSPAQQSQNQQVNGSRLAGSSSPNPTTPPPIPPRPSQAELIAAGVNSTGNPAPSQNREQQGIITEAAVSAQQVRQEAQARAASQAAAPTPPPASGTQQPEAPAQQQRQFPKPIKTIPQPPGTTQTVEQSEQKAVIKGTKQLPDLPQDVKNKAQAQGLGLGLAGAQLMPTGTPSDNNLHANTLASRKSSVQQGRS